MYGKSFCGASALFLYVSCEAPSGPLALAGHGALPLRSRRRPGRADPCRTKSGVHCAEQQDQADATLVIADTYVAGTRRRARTDASCDRVYGPLVKIVRLSGKGPPSAGRTAPATAATSTTLGGQVLSLPDTYHRRP